MDEGRAYAECQTCSWGCSGQVYKVSDKADSHEYENPGHKVEISEERAEELGP